MTKAKEKFVLTAFSLKVIACVLMFIDHFGLMVCPNIVAFRVIGRLAFPIFAYFIAEGCRYTKNKLNRFLSVFILGVVCEVIYVLFNGRYYGNILLTFSFSIVLIYLLFAMKKAYIKSIAKGLLMTFVFALSMTATALYCHFFGVDYGFFGVLIPVFVLVLDDIPKVSEKLYCKIDRKYVSIAMLSIGLCLMSCFSKVPDYEIVSVLSVVFLLFYNGQRGRYKFKYGFYLFYPLHLLLLEAISFIVNIY